MFRRPSASYNKGQAAGSAHLRGSPETQGAPRVARWATRPRIGASAQSRDRIRTQGHEDGVSVNEPDGRRCSGAGGAGRAGACRRVAGAFLRSQGDSHIRGRERRAVDPGERARHHQRNGDIPEHGMRGGHHRVAEKQRRGGDAREVREDALPFVGAGGVRMRQACAPPHRAPAPKLPHQAHQRHIPRDVRKGGQGTQPLLRRRPAAQHHHRGRGLANPQRPDSLPWMEHAPGNGRRPPQVR